MERRSNISRARTSGVLTLALVLTLAACASTTNTAASTDSTASATTAFTGPPVGTPPPLKAPPRAVEPVFTGEAADVEAAFLTRLDAFEHKDVDAAIAATSNPVPDDVDVLASFMESYEVRLYRINAITVDGDTATIDYENAIVGRDLASEVTTLLGQHDIWTREEGEWKFVSDIATTPGIPEDLTAVTATLGEDGQVVLPNTLPVDDFAFLVENTGDEARRVYILGVPEDLDLSTLPRTIARVEAERKSDPATPFPDGILEMGSTPEVVARGVGTMVFSDKLPKGRYAFLTSSAIDDPSELSRYAEFTVD